MSFEAGKEDTCSFFFSLNVFFSLRFLVLVLLFFVLFCFVSFLGHNALQPASFGQSFSSLMNS